MAAVTPLELFSRIDTNGDGFIDQTELLSYCNLLRLPDASIATLSAHFGAQETISLPAFTAALSGRVRPSDLAPHLPSGSPPPSAAAVEAAFAALSTRGGTPQGCLHVDDLRVALRDALPALDRARAAPPARQPRARGTPLKGGAAPPPPPPPQLPPLRDRINALLAGLPVSPSGFVRYAELVALLMGE
jgi:hypothetical protein